ncbi:MAG: FecR domain-containing protein [Acidobacteriota bacterium]
MARTSAASRRDKSRDWYSVSVESVRRTVLLLLAVVVVIVGAFSYQQWQLRVKEETARQLLDEASGLSRQLEDRADYGQVRREFFAAWEDLDSGQEAFRDGRFARAVTLLRSSVGQFKDVLARDQGPAENRGQFLNVSGSVEYRRGERGAWRRARPEDAINPGDWVKTSAGGSATVRFPDGSSYTLRPNTMVHLSAQTNRFGRSEQVAEMSFGWLELSTEDNTGKVKTPNSEAQVRSSSAAMVAYDRSSEEARFATYSGSMEVVAENGQSRLLGALQQIVQEGDLLSGPSSLPARPRLTFPPEDRSFSLDSREIRLTWRAVAGAEKYALNVSKGRLFATNIIDNERTKTSARLGLRADGRYFWQVAAIGADGQTRGPWSEPRSFRVVQPQRSADNDRTPPALTLEDVQTYGSMLIVSGRTEAGATLTLNGEEVAVKSDGSFSERIVMDGEGFAFVSAAATDGAGNTSQEQRRVFIDSAN